MWLIPVSERRRMEAWVMSCPHSVIFPADALSSPVSAWTNSVCPLPSMPAMQTISPARTVRDTSFTASFLCSFEGTERCSIARIGSVGCAGPFSTTSWTGRPTIMELSSSLVVDAVSTVPIYRPLRRTVTRSETSMISLSLWEMNSRLFPSAARPRMIFMSSSISCGVSTAVGSSKIRISLSR